MKKLTAAGLLLLVAACAAVAMGKTLTQDPLTGLPIIPQTDPGLNLGNEPTKLPSSKICKSSLQTEFYSLYSIQISATLDWYSSHLSGFKKVHGFSMQRSQDAFYNTDGTLIVSITGTPAPDRQDSRAYSATYIKAEPGLSANAITTMLNGKVVCP